MRTLWQHCHAATMSEGRYSAIEDAAIVTSAGQIEWIGPRADVPPVAADRVVDLGGAWVTRADRLSYPRSVWRQPQR